MDKINVLAVDDKRENLLAIDAVLTSEEIRLHLANSGQEALGLMLDIEFAVVLLDVMMPDMDGFETAELMRGNEQTRYTPIIFTTAISKEQEHVFRGYETGAVDYLFKPLSPDILRSKVQVFIELYRRKTEIEKSHAKLTKRNRELENALAEIKTLKGLLPICSNCKKIRDDKGYWNQIEAYISERSQAEFSHSICPECVKELYPDFDVR